MIPPMTKANTPSRYLIITRDRKISFKRKLIRFMVRYIIPVVILALAIINVDVWLFKSNNFESVDKFLFIGIILGISAVCIVISNYWFKLISRIEDK